MFKNSKFIIVDDRLYLGRVDYHKDLLLFEDKSSVKGGGWFMQDSKTITFYGSSEDFGKANQSDVEKCIEDKKIFWFGNHNISDKFDFLYKKETESV